MNGFAVRIEVLGNRLNVPSEAKRANSGLSNEASVGPGIRDHAFDPRRTGTITSATSLETEHTERFATTLVAILPFRVTRGPSTKQ